MRLSESFRSPFTGIRPWESFRVRVLAKRHHDAAGGQMGKKRQSNLAHYAGTIFYLNVSLMRTLLVGKNSRNFTFVPVISEENY